jgi:hypothetical protein
MISLQLSDDLMKEVSDEIRHAVKKHLGENSFVEEGIDCTNTERINPNPPKLDLNMY